MALKYLLDEHLRGGLYSAILQHNLRHLGLPVEAVRVGDFEDLPLGSSDREILLWAGQEDRILVTLDRDTLPAELQKLLGTGEHSPGVIVLNAGRSRWEIVEYLELVAHAMDVAELRDNLLYGP